MEADAEAAATVLLERHPGRDPPTSHSSMCRSHRYSATGKFVKRTFSVRGIQVDTVSVLTKLFANNGIASL